VVRVGIFGGSGRRSTALVYVLDGRKPRKAGRTFVLRHLSPGRHRLSVRTTDGRSPTARATRTFVVKPPPPSTAPAVTSAPVTPTPTAPAPTTAAPPATTPTTTSAPPPPPTTTAPPPQTSTTPSGGIPQGPNAGDGDGDNQGAPSDGDGNL
jgi:hypothetical protein